MSILWGGASDSVHRQSGRCTRWRASCAFLCCAQRQVPTVLSFWQGSVCCSTLTRRRCLGNAVALWRLVKEFHIFSACCSRSSLGIWTLFLEPLVLAATCPCALRQSTEAFGRISSIFYVKSGLGSPCSSHLEIWNYFYEQYLAVTACVSLRCFWKNFTYFHRVGCPGFPAQFALENLDIISTCSHMAVGWGFSAALTHFSRSSGLSRS